MRAAPIADGLVCPRCAAETLTVAEDGKTYRYCSTARCAFGIDADVIVPADRVPSPLEALARALAWFTPLEVRS